MFIFHTVGITARCVTDDKGTSNLRDDLRVSRQKNECFNFFLRVIEFCVEAAHMHTYLRAVQKHQWQQPLKTIYHFHML